MTDRVAQSRNAINPFYRMDEQDVVTFLLRNWSLEADSETNIHHRAARWIQELRNNPGERTLLEDFMQRYSLSTDEGVALMSIAEAFLRVPDTDMADRLIVDKITGSEWHAEGENEKLMTAFSGWGLRLSETILKQEKGVLGGLAKRLGLPVIRHAIAQAIKLLGGQFVCGRTISEAIKTAASYNRSKYRFSYDMLGEGARTAETAEYYFQSYKNALHTLGKSRRPESLHDSDSISIKLSALHPRYEEFQRDYCLPILVERVTELAVLAKHYNFPITLDAEEADRLELSLDIFTQVYHSGKLENFEGFGLAVQAYQKRALTVIHYLTELARTSKRRIPVRLVKGAYWDTEIKRAQERGLSGYPVYTRKASTDASYLAAANAMLAANDAIYPAFATHNAHTISAVLELTKNHGCRNYEFQRLYGMGEQLYDTAFANEKEMPKCRIYAPVGAHKDLLPYLVRRLLENGANSSFVHQIYDKTISVEKLAKNPVELVRSYQNIANPHIKLPVALYGDRPNSIAPDMSDRNDRENLLAVLPKYQQIPAIPDTEPGNIDRMMDSGFQAWKAWNRVSALKRADILDRIADLYTHYRDELIGICVCEGKKTIPDAIAEWRESVDFCRYYAQQARQNLGHDTVLPGPTGESNRLRLEGRGVFVCISPWNFPLAIFTGQVVAALVAGNAVIAKPAEQTPYIAKRAAELMIEAGIPRDVLQIVTGKGEAGAACIRHGYCAGVAFTGSTETAWRIQSALADKRGPIVPFIAETGGQNAMIADSTALPEQVVDDVIRSAFHSAGQRCSALRVLYLQQDIAQPVLDMLKGAMQELRVGDPAQLETDLGPVIDKAAQTALLDHAARLENRKIAQSPVNAKVEHCVTPTVFSIQAINELDKENFGPLLHVITYPHKKIDEVVNSINEIGYGLTLGIHSRVDSVIDKIIQQARVGNIYVNRGMTGAVVGVQPFGGMGLSGTGPKAGGPHYLYRFVTEKTITVNTMAAGGNTMLATLTDD